MLSQVDSAEVWLYSIPAFVVCMDPNVWSARHRAI